MALIGFWKTNERYGAFSQWFIAPFSEDRISFPSAEHYMMYHKALLFGDTAIARQVLAVRNPKDVKALGRKVRGFNEELWNQKRIEIVLRGNLLKFGQNPDLKRLLLSTGEAELAELSPYDKIWGTGSTSQNPSDWPRDSLNLLGHILMETRKQLK